MIVGILLAVPGQSAQVLGIELIILAAATAAGLVALDRRAKGDARGEGIARVLDVVAPNTITSVLLLVAGVILLFGARIGLYVLVVPVLAALVGGVASAWLFMTRVTEQTAPPNNCQTSNRALSPPTPSISYITIVHK